MTQIRKEIYDENGLVEVIFIEVDEPTQKDLIAQKEAQLLEMYQELQTLKVGISNSMVNTEDTFGNIKE